MKLVFLGTGGYHPSDRRQTACIMLPEIGLVLDAGTAFYRVRDQISTSSLDVFLTHPHLDHVIGLTYLFDVLWGHEDVVVRVHGSATALTAIQEHLFAKPLFPIMPPIQWVPLAEQVTLGDGAQLTHFPLEHPGGSLGYRIDWPGRSLAYVTDTTARENADYLPHIQDVDLLIHECYFPDELADRAELTGHSCVTPVARIAASAGAKRLVLVHVNPLTGEEDPIGLEESRAIFAQTELGLDGLEIDF